MNCPKCGGKTSVTDSREFDPEFTMRKRKCKDCGYKFETREYEADLIEHILKMTDCAR